MQSRFMKGDKNPTLLILASSKRTEQSYMETFIESKKKNESKSTLVIDKPQWEIREDKNSKEKFKVAIGNKFLASEVLPLDVSEKDLSIFRDKGFTIIDVPMGYYENFIDDIDIALTDIAGISTSSSNRYISGPRLAKVRNTDIKNPFTQEIIEVGNDPEDTVQYYDFFDMEKIDRSMMEKPLYIHLDMSISGDKTGIAGVWIKGKKPPVEGQPASKELFYQLAFHVSVKAPKGFQISFEKNRQFIYWLREQGFAIKEVTSDTFQSADLLQQLSAHGYTTNILSVDRVDTDHICKPYQYFKSTIYEERIAFYENKHLTEEIIGLERNNNSGKIDHSPMGINEKDACDAVCGALWTASKHGEEFDFDYGDTLDVIIDVAEESTPGQEKEQLTLDFENELKRTSNIFSKELTKDKEDNKDSTYLDFGLGAATTDFDPFLDDGIII